MKRALRDALIFVLCFLILFCIMDRLTFEETGTAEVWDYIQEGNPEPIDILFMGSSHAYCSVNPAIINQCMDLNTMLLGGGSQPMDQIYENLKVLLHYVHPKVIVLESSAVSLTTDVVYRNKTEGLLYANFDSIRNPIYKMGAIVHTIKKYSKWPEAYSQLFRPTNTWKRIFDHNSSDAESRFNYILGFRPQNNIIQDVTDTPAMVEHTLIEAREKGGSLTHPESVDALHNFLDLCEQEGIPVYIFKSPVLLYENELPIVARIMAKLAQKEPAIKGYRNFSEQITEIGIEIDDFSDVGHLNREGATKFTICLMDWLSEELGIPYDLSKATGIKEESVQELPDGRYRYTVSLLDNTQIKFIQGGEKGEIISETEYSDVNYFDMPPNAPGNTLSYRIRAKREIPGRSYPFEKIEYKFMHK